MKFAIWALIVAVTVAPTLMPTDAVAKSVKWRCVILDPAHPENRYCTPAPGRP